MTKITNTYGGPLGLPNGFTLQRGVNDVPDWELVEGHDVVKAWIAAEVLIVGKEGGEVVQPPKAPEPAKVEPGPGPAQPENPIAVANDILPPPDEPEGSVDDEPAQPANPAVAGLDLEALSLPELQALAKDHGMAYNKTWGAARLRKEIVANAADDKGE